MDGEPAASRVTREGPTLIHAPWATEEPAGGAKRHLPAGGGQYAGRALVEVDTMGGGWRNDSAERGISGGGGKAVAGVGRVTASVCGPTHERCAACGGWHAGSARVGATVLRTTAEPGAARGISVRRRIVGGCASAAGAPSIRYRRHVAVNLRGSVGRGRALPRRTKPVATALAVASVTTVALRALAVQRVPWTAARIAVARNGCVWRDEGVACAIHLATISHHAASAQATGAATGSPAVAATRVAGGAAAAGASRPTARAACPRRAVRCVAASVGGAVVATRRCTVRAACRTG
jgi:hypothetical protein